MSKHENEKKDPVELFFWFLVLIQKIFNLQFLSFLLFELMNS